jgi:hypothetical protein
MRERLKMTALLITSLCAACSTVAVDVDGGFGARGDGGAYVRRAADLDGPAQRFAVGPVGLASTAVPISASPVSVAAIASSAAPAKVSGVGRAAVAQTTWASVAPSGPDGRVLAAATPFNVVSTETSLQPWLSSDRSFDAGVTLTARGENTGLGVDVSVTPRAGFAQNFGSRATSAGAEFRLGDLAEPTTPTAGSWYVFAAADGEAVRWDLDGRGSTDMFGGLGYSEQGTVGDLQAGIALSQGAGQWSLSYIRREFQFEDREAQADAAALVFTIRR